MCCYALHRNATILPVPLPLLRKICLRNFVLSKRIIYTFYVNSRFDELSSEIAIPQKSRAKTFGTMIENCIKKKNKK